MKTIAKKCIQKSIQVIDRFHVQKISSEALQEIRIKQRCDVIDLENEALKLIKHANHKCLVMEILEK